MVLHGLLGPFVLDVIHFRTSASGLNQIRGGDLAALIVVAPTCFAVAGLARRGHPSAPMLALAPAMFAMYTYSQLILANEYLYRPGNVERFFPPLLAMFLSGAAVVLRCWGQLRPQELPSSTLRLQRGSGIPLVVMAAFVVLALGPVSWTRGCQSCAVQRLRSPWYPSRALLTFWWRGIQHRCPRQRTGPT